MGKLKGKIALVTGAGRGIGRAIARKLAQEGAIVAVHYGKSRDLCAGNGARAGKQRGDCLCSGGRPGDVKRSGDAVRSNGCGAGRKGEADHHLDILVNNAGIALYGSVENTPEVAFDTIFSVNVKAPFYLIQNALPRMREEGRIINLSSAVTRIAIPDIAAYSMTKGAINTLTLTLAKQTWDPAALRSMRSCRDSSLRI